jgi:hypothetical protein
VKYRRGYGVLPGMMKSWLAFWGETARPKITTLISPLSPTNSSDRGENFAAHFTPRFAAFGDSGITGT